MDMTQEKERTKQAATAIVDNIIDLQMVLAGQTSLQAMRLMRNIQTISRSLISGGDQADAPPVGVIGQGYRLDMLEVLQGLAEVLCCEQGEVKGELSDDDLHIIALAAEAAHGRINNYLLVKRAENAIHRRTGGPIPDRPAA